MFPKDADGMAERADPDQVVLIWHSKPLIVYKAIQTYV